VGATQSACYWQTYRLLIGRRVRAVCVLAANIPAADWCWQGFYFISVHISVILPLSAFLPSTTLSRIRILTAGVAVESTAASVLVVLVVLYFEAFCTALCITEAEDRPSMS